MRSILSERTLILPGKTPISQTGAPLFFFCRMGLAALVFVATLAFTGCGSGQVSKKSTTPDSASKPTGAAPAGAMDDRPVIVALGDSLTAGLGVAPPENYPAKLQARINSEGFRYRVVNAGVSGDTSAQGLNRLDTVCELHPEIVILALGANDGLRGLPVQATEGNLKEIISRLSQDGTRVILAGMEMPPNFGPDYTRSFRQIFKDLAKEFHLPLIPFLLEGVGGVARLNQEDGIHPTSEGYAIVTENIWKMLKPLLKKH